MTAPASLAGTIDDLRRAFDGAFAAPPETTGDGSEHLLAIRVAGDHYALRLRDMSGLIMARKIVPVPSRVPELLGIAGLRGGLVHVYSLAVLLDYRSATEQPCWWALAGTDGTIAFAFHEFQGLLRVRVSDLHAAGPLGTARSHLGEIVRDSVPARAVIRIPSLVESIEGRGDTSRPAKE